MKSVLLSVILTACCCTPTFAADNALSQAEKQAGWILLFNGTDFSQWKLDQWNPESFSIEEGAIKCHGNPSMMYYTGDGAEMTDFHFIADVMTKPGANGGIFFHTKYQDKGWPIGHEAQINMTQGDPIKTGSVYIVKNNLTPPAKDNEWFKYEIIVRGSTIETKVNGKTVVTYEEPADAKGTRRLSSGTIGIQAHDPGSIVLLKNIRVLPLIVSKP